MMTRFVIEGIIAALLIVGLIFEERIAVAERRWFKKIMRRSAAKQKRSEHIKLKMREARYQRQQLQREMELIELGLDPRPSLKVISKKVDSTFVMEPGNGAITELKIFIWKIISMYMIMFMVRKESE